MNNCIEFKGDGKSQMPCENIKFENFDSLRNFDDQQFKSFIKEKYNYEQFKFPKEYGDIEKIQKGNKIVARQQQKFVSKYSNFHNNFEGLLVWHGLGSGKCLALDTPILMYDGSIKKVQDVKPREFVMGDDSTPREVLSLGRGQQQMYDIVPTKGNTFGCNSEHILCLTTSNKGVYYKKDKRKKNQQKFWVAEWIDTQNITKRERWFETKEEADAFFNSIKGITNTINIEVKDFIKLPKSTQSQLKLYRTGVDFREQETPLDPYNIGLWLGDTNKDNTNKYLKELNLTNNKHIPNVYKINSRKNRLQLLAGIIDTNGSLNRNGCFVIIQKNERLANDIEYLVRSLGLYTKIQKCEKSSQNGTICTYYRMCISGNIEEVPTKIPRKKANTRKQKKNVLVTGFKVIPKGLGNYYGFTVDKNHKFLLGDFTVTHNTCTSILVGEAYIAYKNNKCRGISNGKDDRIIVVLPSATVEQFREELAGRINEDNEIIGCVSDNVLFNGKDVKYREPLETVKVEPDFKDRLLEIQQNIKRNKNTQRRQISKRNRITSKQVQSKIFKDDTQILIDKCWNITTTDKFINNLFINENNLVGDFTKQLIDGGKIVIIDEIQNLINETGVRYRKLLKTIRLYSRNNRFLVLSATPIYNRPYEIGLTLNTLNPRMFFPENETEFKKMFIKNDEIINKDLFYWMCNGYISYFSGGNPNNFPYKRIIEIKHKMSEQQLSGYVEALTSQLKSFNKKKDTELEEKVQQNFLSKTREYSNIYYKNEITFKLEIQATKNKFTSMDQYSKKISYIGKQLYNCEGTCIVYSEFVDYGIKPLSILLDQLEFQQITGSDIQRYSFKDHNNPTKDELDSIFKVKKNRYTMWSTSIIKKVKMDEYSSKVRAIFNSKHNKDGKYIKAILGTRTMAEGVSLYNVRNMHIMNPWWNEARIEQVIARAVRFNSHIKMNSEQRYVNIFKHYSVYPDKNISHMLQNITDKGKKTKVMKSSFYTKSVDEYMKGRSETKKKISREFEIIMKAASVDCDFNKYGNLVRLEEHINEVSSEGNLISYKKYFKNPSNGKNYIENDSYPTKDYLLEKNEFYLDSYFNKIEDKQNQAKKFKRIDINEWKFYEPEEIIITKPGNIINEDINCDLKEYYNPSEKESSGIIEKYKTMSEKYKNPNVKELTSLISIGSEENTGYKLKDILNCIYQTSKEQNKIEELIKFTEDDKQERDKPTNYIHNFIGQIKEQYKEDVKILREYVEGSKNYKDDYDLLEKKLGKSKNYIRNAIEDYQGLYNLIVTKYSSKDIPKL